MKKLQTIALCLLITFMSCDRDDSPSNNDQNQGPDPIAFAENFGSEIQRSFLGNVIDQDHNPIQGVTITIGNLTAQTDTNGVFIISDATVNERFGYVKAEKEGYLHGSRSVVPSIGTNKLTIMLLEENIVGTTNSGTAETIALSNGASVALKGNYKKEDGTAYSGSVNVIMHHLDPADDDMKDQMPGMLYAANAQNEERMLQTFGMLAVELKGSGGETLNLADGSSAEIKVPLDVSLMANAPSTIPLWHFDETYGYWIEDGQATLVGNAYVGTVRHFSFWNCDVPMNAVILNVTVNDENNNPLSYLGVSIVSLNYGAGYGITNTNGLASGFIPSNESLLLTVVNYQLCGNLPLYTETIGPYSTDSSITVSIPYSTQQTSQRVIGDFNACDGSPVTNGYVQMRYSAYYFFDNIDDGNFELNLLSCGTNVNNFSLKAYDYTNVQETNDINFTFSAPVTDVGTLTACNNIEEFITYQIDNDTIYTSYVNFTATFSPNASPNLSQGLTIYTQVGNGNQNSCFYMNGRLNAAPYVGTYDHLFYNDPNDTGFLITECFDMSDVNNNITYNLTTLGNVGEYIDINFSGSYERYDGSPHTITGTIHVLRDQ